MKTMERNEAVRFETMKEGMPWDWGIHPEFMDSIERTPRSKYGYFHTTRSINDVCNG